MKLQTLTLKNFLGATAEYAFKPITVFAGPNESGKSRVAHAISFVLNEGIIREVEKKKDLVQLLTEGAKSGGVELGMQNLNIGRTLPDGECNALGDGAIVHNRCLRACLDIHAFQAIDLKDRGEYLMRLAGTEIAPNDIRRRLEEKNLDAAKIEMVLPMIITSFEAAEDYAKEEARQEKANWRAITGRVWSQKNGDEWEPEPVAAVELAYPAKKHEEKITAAEDKLQGLYKRMAQMEAAKKLQSNPLFDAGTIESMEAELESLATRIREISGKTEKLSSRHKAAHEELEPITAQLQDMIIACPKCGQPLQIEPTGNPGEFEVTEKTGEIFPRKASALVDKQQSLSAEIKQIMEDIEQHDADKLELHKKMSALGEQIDTRKLRREQNIELAGTDEVITGAMLQEMRERIEKYRAYTDRLRNEYSAWESAEKQRKQASDDAKKASVHHAAVTHWLELARALSADGIQSEIVMDALAPINERLKAYADASGMGRVVINQDMTTTYRGRPYHLNSESAQWRADLMLAVMIAEMSGIGFVVVDRLDILDLVSRGQVMRWLAAHQDTLQVVVMATLKAPVSESGALICHWLGE